MWSRDIMLWRFISPNEDDRSGLLPSRISFHPASLPVQPTSAPFGSSHFRSELCNDDSFGELMPVCWRSFSDIDSLACLVFLLHFQSCVGLVIRNSQLGSVS